MRGQTVSFIVGALASLAASYLYSWLTSAQGGYLYFAGSVVLGGGLAALIYAFRARLRVPLYSGVVGYFPKGQEQYLPYLLKDIGKAKTIFLLGARGMDLIGERSPIGNFLVEKQWQGQLEVHLLDPDSTFARLRPNSLKADVDKYRAECKAVESFLQTLPSRFGISLVQETYRKEPRLRAILCDDIGYVAFYQKNMQGRALPTYRIRFGSRPLRDLVQEYARYLGREEESPPSSSATWK